jgi:general secretion pathway protein D
LGNAQLSGGQASAKEAVFGGEVKVTSDKNTNSLVITASKQDYDSVLSIIGLLDIARDQVFVETLIMELTLSDGLNTGAGFYQFYKPAGKIGFSTSGTDVSDFLSPMGGAGSAILRLCFRFGEGH